MADVIDAGVEATDLLTVPEVAKRLRVADVTIWRLIATGELRSVKVGRLRRIAPEAVIDYKRDLDAAEQARRAAAAEILAAAS